MKQVEVKDSGAFGRRASRTSRPISEPFEYHQLERIIVYTDRFHLSCSVGSSVSE